MFFKFHLLIHVLNAATRCFYDCIFMNDNYKWFCFYYYYYFYRLQHDVLRLSHAWWIFFIALSYQFYIRVLRDFIIIQYKRELIWGKKVAKSWDIRRTGNKRVYRLKFVKVRIFVLAQSLKINMRKYIFFFLFPAAATTTTKITSAIRMCNSDLNSAYNNVQTFKRKKNTL